MSIEVFLIPFLLFIVICLLLILAWTIRNGISPMPTAPKVKKKLLEIVPDMSEGNIFELGSGWGTLAVRLAQKYPSCTITGFENSPLPYFYSYISQKISPISNLIFKNSDFFDVSFIEANMIICYLCPSLMQRLKEKFERELQPGTVIVSHTFAVPGWQPDKIVLVDDLYHTPIYFYHKHSNK